MTVWTPNLDDLDYPGLLAILRSHIPGEEWSDHNPSDPGIALLELLAWLGEMSLYRMNRVPEAHQDKFLKLVADPPEPVTVNVTVRLQPPRAEDFPLPPGLRFATDYRNGRRVVFETSARAVLPKPEDGEAQKVEVKARAIRDLTDVVLGVADGRPNQTFALPDFPDRPVALDPSARAPGYDPNPRVRVGTDEWELRESLLTAASTGTPPPRHFTVDRFENLLRFGDGTFGAVPPAGATIRLIHAEVMEGWRALVAAGQVKYLLNPEIVPGLLAGERLDAGNDDAEGGRELPGPQDDRSFFSRKERLRRGLEAFREPYRVVTAGDFERVATRDFNEFARRFNEAQGFPVEDETVRRAAALVNRKPPLAANASAPGHVTILVLPVLSPQDQATFDTGTPAQKAALVTPSSELRARLLAYLEPRRLITTRLHVVGPELKPVSVQVVVVADGQRNVAEMRTAVERALSAFLSLTEGHQDKKGWPLGATVRRSHLFDVLEGVPGVDHVELLSLSAAGALGDVELGPLQLPVWESVLVQVRRA